MFAYGPLVRRVRQSGLPSGPKGGDDGALSGDDSGDALRESPMLLGDRDLLSSLLRYGDGDLLLLK